MYVEYSEEKHKALSIALLNVLKPQCFHSHVHKIPLYFIFLHDEFSVLLPSNHSINLSVDIYSYC